VRRPRTGALAGHACRPRRLRSGRPTLWRSGCGVPPNSIMIASRTSVLFVLSIAGPPLRAFTDNKDRLNASLTLAMSSSIVSWTLANEGVDRKANIAAAQQAPGDVVAENQLSKATKNASGRQCAAEFWSIDKPQDLRPASRSAEHSGHDRDTRRRRRRCLASRRSPGGGGQERDRASEASTQAWCRTHQDRSVASSVMSALNSLDFRVVTPTLREDRYVTASLPPALKIIWPARSRSPSCEPERQRKSSRPRRV
jgi:hypothetical protein